MVNEALSFLWALVDYNPRMSCAIITCNVEAPHAAQTSSGNPRDWPAILVNLSCSHQSESSLLIFTHTDSMMLIALRASQSHSQVGGQRLPRVPHPLVHHFWYLSAPAGGVRYDYRAPRPQMSESGSSKQGRVRATFTCSLHADASCLFWQDMVKQQTEEKSVKFT